MYNSNSNSNGSLDEFDYISSYPYNLNNNEYYYNTDTDRETEDLSSTEFHFFNKRNYSKAQYGVLSSDSSDSGYDVYNQNSYYENRSSNYNSSSVPNQNQVVKCRQLPCRTFISTGSCPYGDRCVFLHDMSIVSKPVYIRSKRKSKDEIGTDAFFWPTMPWNAVMSRVDNRNLPLIFQPYIVPAPNSYCLCNSNNDVAVYSMWEHFLDFCKIDSLSIVTVPRNVPLPNPYTRMNPYTGKKRLPIFIQFSQN